MTIRKSTCRFLSVFLALVFLVGLIPSELITFKAKASTSGYYTYSVTNGEAEITDVDTSINGNITIPSTLGGYPVTSIGEWAFYNCESITSITIPDSVTSIGNYAFSRCDSLTSIIIGDGVTSIGEGAFEYCDSLTSIIIGDGVTSIGYGAFYDCTSLTDIIIGKSVTSIGKSAFYNCESLTSITIPDSVTSIGNYAFYNCVSLKDVWYTGTEEQKNKISIGDYNTKLTSATWHYNTCKEHTYTSLCDAECNLCDWTRETDVEHTYTNSCDTTCIVCGHIRTITHTWKTEYSFDENTHWIECSVCKEKQSTPVTHKYDNSCDTTCNVCGKVRTITHTWKTEYSFDENTHWIECSVCKEKQNTPVTHKYDNSCDTTCNVCGKERTITHTWKTEYSFDENTHWIECSVCGDKQNTPVTHKYDNSCDTTCNMCGQVRTITHTWKTKYSFDENTHWIECSVCGEKQSTPVTHKYDNSCDTTCNVCGKVRTITHTWKTEYSYDENTHWIECSVCGDKQSTPVTHKYDNACDTTCNVCGKERTVPDHSYTLNGNHTCGICKYSKIPQQPTVESKTTGKVVLEKTEGFEYSKDGINWQTSNVFSDLSENTTYTFYQRVKSSYNALESEISQGTEVVFKSFQKTPSSPLIISFTYTSVTLFAIENGEYSKDGINWQTSNVFENLSPATEYTFYQRYAETEIYDHSDMSEGTSITTEKSKQTLVPDAPTMESYTKNSITLTKIDGLEYSKDGKNWQTSNVFYNLSPATEYTFYQRYAETSSHYAGVSSVGATFKTDKGTQSAPSAPTLESKTHNTVTLTAISGYEYSLGGMEWQTSNVFTGLSAETNYMFYQRRAETETYYASAMSSYLIVKTSEISPDSEYYFDEAKGTMPNVLPKTTVETLKGGTNGKITVVYDLDGNVVADTENIGTGYKVVADGKEYTVIVKGDLDGDGAISTTDYYRIKMSLLGDYQLEEIYADAADADKDGKITTTDFMRIKAAFIGDFEL